MNSQIYKKEIISKVFPFTPSFLGSQKDSISKRDRRKLRVYTNFTAQFYTFRLILNLDLTTSSSSFHLHSGLHRKINGNFYYFLPFFYIKFAISQILSHFFSLFIYLSLEQIYHRSYCQKSFVQFSRGEYNVTFYSIFFLSL